MEQRLKERLTGAAILVALIVLIVPELFHGHLSERAGRAASSSDGPPLRSYLIDLGANHSSPMQLGAASARGLAAAPAAGTPVASGAPVAAAPTPAPLAAAPSASMGPTTRPPSVPAATTGPRPAHARAVADWSVQLGLYAKRVNAEHMVRIAHTKGFSASLAKPDAKGRYRVRVAGLTSRSAALTLAARLRAAGLPAAAVGPR